MSRLPWTALPCLAAAALAVAVAAPPRRAAARPEYARKEGLACAHCHMDARGGGPRTAAGLAYERAGLKFPDAGEGKGFGENRAFTTEANGTAFYFVREAIDLQHWGDALRRLADLKKRETRGAGAQLVLNTEAQVLNRGNDLVRKARSAITGGRAEEAAEAIVRLEAEFKGRDPAKDVVRLKAELQRLPGAKEAEAKARAVQPQRTAYLDALMKEVEGDLRGAAAALESVAAKWPDGPFAALATARAAALRAQAAPPAGDGGSPSPAMGG